MSTAVYVLPAAAVFLVASLLFTRAKKAPDSARLLVPIASILFVVGLVLLGLGFYRLFTGA